MRAGVIARLSGGKAKMQVDYLRKGFHDPRWPLDICRTITIGDTGLVFGKGTCLARFSGDGRQLDFEADRERLFALLSVTYKKAISPGMVQPLEAAAHHWARGEKALANLRLAFANLPPLADPHDAYRLSLAENLLDHGMAPRELMKELGLDPAVLDFNKYNPAQPRVPAGNGRESGRWGPGGGGAASTAHPSTFVVAAQTTNFEYACKILKLNPIEASGALHAAKEAAGLSGADQCSFDLKTGDIFHRGEHIGNLGD